MVKGRGESTTGAKQSLLANIKNKVRRTTLMLKLRYELRKQRDKEKDKRQKHRQQTGEAAPEPKTIERMREPDETMVTSDNEEVHKEEAVDEFASYYKNEYTPKVLMTTCKKPSAKLTTFMQEIAEIFPNSHFYDRKNFELKKIVEYATNREFTDIIAVSERLRKPDGLWLIHLPDGPTAYFRLTNIWRRKSIPFHGNPTGYYPELIMKNFDTRLGQRLGRMLAAIFPQNPDFRGRNVITFHNQRDFIFFRHHRYIFNDKGDRVTLQEVGPRMTLKLMSVQHGTFDPKFGNYEYMYHPKMQVSRKKFFI